MFRRIALSAALTAAALVAPRIAQAQYEGAVLTSANLCILPFEGLGNGRVAARTGSCAQSGARYKIENGVMRTSDNLCLDHGVTSAMTPTASNDGVIFAPCHGGASQIWFFMKHGLAQNSANTKVCLDVEGGNAAAGARIIVWPCDYKTSQQAIDCANGVASSCPRPNQRFYVGVGKISSITLQQSGMISAAQATSLASGRTLINDMNGARIVAGGGGNIVAAGGGNIVAAGGGNIVAAGGGNIRNDKYVSLIGQDGTSLRSNITLTSSGFRVQ